MKYCLLLFFAFASISNLTSQNKCDSLIEDICSKKVRSINDLQAEIYNSIEYKTCIQLALNKKTDTKQLGKLKYFYGNILYKNFEISKADSLYNTSLKLTIPYKDSLTTFYNYMGKCLVSLNLNKEHQFLTFYNKGISFIDTNNINETYGFAIFLKAFYLARKSEQEKALTILLNNIDEIEKTKDDNLILSYYNSISELYSEFNLFDDAKKYLTKGINKSKAIQHKNYESVFNFNIGNIYYNEKNYDKAITHYKESIDFFIKNKDNFNIANAYLEIAKAYTGKNQFNSANQNFREAIRYSQLIESNVLISITNLNYGKSLLQFKKILRS